MSRSKGKAHRSGRVSAAEVRDVWQRAQAEYGSAAAAEAATGWSRNTWRRAQSEGAGGRMAEWVRRWEGVSSIRRSVAATGAPRKRGDTPSQARPAAGAGRARVARLPQTSVFGWHGKTKWFLDIGARVRWNALKDRMNVSAKATPKGKKYHKTHVPPSTLEGIPESGPRMEHRPDCEPGAEHHPSTVHANSPAEAWALLLDLLDDLDVTDDDGNPYVYKWVDALLVEVGQDEASKKKYQHTGPKFYIMLHVVLCADGEATYRKAMSGRTRYES